ncbi:hypothetical protein KGF56_002320 [Candida oxycetoniae]|uniref:Uncharacterized protein n=1 Tax=Candida oxycetoniae TaxID=497107 RepID=A0AAI9SXY0_9ASCO|nr:uncharacterized protein KGF56_002320 [Candida oxycetoniae]KAI3404904.1 hypothetical protein KGF56_002320 [Candida oxycetoniae]
MLHISDGYNNKDIITELQWYTLKWDLHTCSIFGVELRGRELEVRQAEMVKYWRVVGVKHGMNSLRDRHQRHRVLRFRHRVLRFRHRVLRLQDTESQDYKAQSPKISFELAFPSQHLSSTSQMYPKIAIFG